MTRLFLIAAAIFALSSATVHAGDKPTDKAAVTKDDAGKAAKPLTKEEEEEAAKKAAAEEAAKKAGH